MSLHRQPTPNTAPNPTETPWLYKVGKLAGVAVAGYAMHRGFNSDALGNTSEHLGSPAAELAELTVIPATLALTGLRAEVTDMRLSIANRREATAKKRELQQKRRSKESADSFTRVMDGTPVAYDTDLARDMIPASRIEKMALVASRRIRHPLRKPHPTDALRHTSSWGHARDVKAMNNARDKRRMHQMEGDAQHKWFGKDATYKNRDTSKPDRETSDLGTRLGWRRFYQLPRTRLEVEGYKNAIRIRDHAEHAAHRITKDAEDKTIVKHERSAGYYKGRRKQIAQHRKKLEKRRTAIRTGQDWQGKTVSKVKQSVKGVGQKVRSRINH